MDMTFSVLCGRSYSSLESFSFIILFYLVGLFKISVCPKGFLLWPLVGTEKVENSPLAPGWYREAPIYYYIHFVISQVVNFFWRYDNWGHTLFRFDYIVR
jgi:hypothetical protein